MKNRIERINSTIKRELSRIISRDIDDPRVSFITILDVDCSSDLKFARVLFHSIVEGKRQELSDILNRASGFISYKLGRKMRLKYTPKLHFHFEDTDDIMKKMDLIKEKKY